MKRSLVSMLVILSGSIAVGTSDGIAVAQSVQEEGPPVKRLVLHPAAEPRPALKYRLLPGLLDLKPGNAAVMYNKAAILVQSSEHEEDQEKLSQWATTSLDELPRKEIDDVLGRHRSVLDELDRAARREVCDWQLPLREQFPFAILLPELQETRKFARLLAVKARVEIADGRFEEAQRTLQTGYALARHAAVGPTLINALVGMAIANTMGEQVEAWVGQPGAPNLYWALTCLPRPMIDMRMAADVEMSTLYLAYPELRGLDEAHTPEYWRELLEKGIRDTMPLVAAESPAISWQPLVVALAIRGYPQAKRYLIEQGRTPEEVEAMPVAQVVLLYTMRTYDELRDDNFKWYNLPYWQAHEGMEEAERRLSTEAKHREIIPLASLLLPAVRALKLNEARCDRTVAVLRTVEAIRMVGAAHDGRLPGRLADVTEMPLPIDPVTGRGFAYRVEGRTAVLEGPAPPGKPADRYAMRYEMEFAQ